MVTFFKQLGVDYVFDVTLSRDLALMERLVRISQIAYQLVYKCFPPAAKSLFQDIRRTRQELCQCWPRLVQV